MGSTNAGIGGGHRRGRAPSRPRSRRSAPAYIGCPRRERPHQARPSPFRLNAEASRRFLRWPPSPSSSTSLDRRRSSTARTRWALTDHGLLWTKRAEEDFRTVWAPQSWRRLEVASEGERQEDVLDIFRTD